MCSAGTNILLLPHWLGPNVMKASAYCRPHISRPPRGRAAPAYPHISSIASPVAPHKAAPAGHPARAFSRWIFHRMDHHGAACAKARDLRLQRRGDIDDAVHQLRAARKVVSFAHKVRLEAGGEMLGEFPSAGPTSSTLPQLPDRWCNDRDFPRDVPTGRR